MEKETNPFNLSVYLDSEHFCDREMELNLLRRNAENGINTTLFAIRRIGKTGLMKHVLNSYTNDKTTVCMYVDILSTASLKDFTNQIATVVYNKFPQNKGIGRKLIHAIKLLRPTISFDSLSGVPEVSFDFGDVKSYENTVQQLFTFLDNQGIRIIFAIDEFQQILTYPEKNIESLLRTHIQGLKNTNFIFCGSDQKIMHELFNDSKRPFFASCSNIHLDFIPRNLYFEFIKHHFFNKKRKISNESIDFILDFTFSHTFYSHYFCNYVFGIQLKKIEIKDVMICAVDILKQNEGTFYQYRSLITTPQWNLLVAIAKETRLYKAHSHLFISKYKLGSSSMVKRSLDALMVKELIYHVSNELEDYYMVYDKFLLRWMQHRL